MELQAITFPKSRFTTKQSRRWLQTYQIAPIKPVDTTLTRLRYRVRPPRKTTYATKILPREIHLVLQQKRKH